MSFENMTVENPWLMLGNCLERMKEIPDGSVDMILCDLPYEVTSMKWDSMIPLPELWESYRRIIRKNGAIVLHASQPFTTLLIASNMKMFKYNWTWEKNSPSGIGLSKYQPMRVTEDIVVFCEGNTKYNKQDTPTIISDRKVVSGKRNGSGSNGSNHYKGMGQVENIQKEFVNPRNLLKFKCVPNAGGHKLHPTQKPLDMIDYLVKTYTDENDVIVDNCMGSGTTGVSCKLLGRRFIGIEMNEPYFEIARNRIANASPKGLPTSGTANTPGSEPLMLFP